MTGAMRAAAVPSRGDRCRVPLSALSRAKPRGVNSCLNPQANQDMALTWAIRPPTRHPQLQAAIAT